MPDRSLLSPNETPPLPPIPSDFLSPSPANGSSSSASIKLRRKFSTRSLKRNSHHAQPKEQKGSFYSKELESARLRGDWDADVPLSAGPRLSWSELIRKHLKHNPNDQTVPSIATAEHQIRSALAAFYKHKEFSDASYSDDYAIPGGTGKSTFPSPLPIEDSGIGWSGQDYGLAIRELGTLRSSARDNVTKLSIAALQAYALFSSGQDEAAVELFHEVRYLEDLNMGSLKAGNFNDEYTLALILMGYAVYGEQTVSSANRKYHLLFVPHSKAWQMNASFRSRETKVTSLLRTPGMLAQLTCMRRSEVESLPMHFEVLLPMK